MSKINHPRYTHAQVGMIIGLLAGGVLASFLFILTGHPLSLALSVLGVWLGFDIGTEFDQRQNRKTTSMSLDQKREPLFLILASLVLFSALFYPLISAGLAIILLIVILGYQLFRSRKPHNRK